MKIAVISDIHGNLEALLAVLRNIDSRGIDMIVCLGDVVSFGPQPAECVETIANMENGLRLLGNRDRYIVKKEFLSESFRLRYPKGFVDNEQWTCQQLTQDHIEHMKTWLKCEETDIDGHMPSSIPQTQKKPSPLSAYHMTVTKQCRVYGEPCSLG